MRITTIKCDICNSEIESGSNVIACDLPVMVKDVHIPMIVQFAEGDKMKVDVRRFELCRSCAEKIAIKNKWNRRKDETNKCR